MSVFERLKSWTKSLFLYLLLLRDDEGDKQDDGKEGDDQQHLVDGDLSSFGCKDNIIRNEIQVRCKLE